MARTLISNWWIYPTFDSITRIPTASMIVADPVPKFASPQSPFLPALHPCAQINLRLVNTGTEAIIKG
jgi:hypothetical protein